MGHANGLTGTIKLTNGALAAAVFVDAMVRLLPGVLGDETSAGDAVLWDRSQALELFNDLKNGQTVPAGLLSGTTVG